MLALHFNPANTRMEFVLEGMKIYRQDPQQY